MRTLLLSSTPRISNPDSFQRGFEVEYEDGVREVTILALIEDDEDSILDDLIEADQSSRTNANLAQYHALVVDKSYVALTDIQEV